MIGDRSWMTSGERVPIFVPLRCPFTGSQPIATHGEKAKISPSVGLEMDRLPKDVWLATFSGGEPEKSGGVGLCGIGIVLRSLGALLG